MTAVICRISTRFGKSVADAARGSFIGCINKNPPDAAVATLSIFASNECQSKMWTFAYEILLKLLPRNFMVYHVRYLNCSHTPWVLIKANADFEVPTTAWSRFHKSTMNQQPYLLASLNAKRVSNQITLFFYSSNHRSFWWQRYSYFCVFKINIGEYKLANNKKNDSMCTAVNVTVMITKWVVGTRNLGSDRKKQQEYITGQ